jgi:isopenicillin N synthase-like dioxygenase
MDSKKVVANATSEDYVGFTPVRHKYNLAEVDDDEFEDVDLRTLDIGTFLHGDEAQRREFAMELGAEMEKIGFAILSDPGADAALHEECSRAVVEYFNSVPVDEKLKFRARRVGACAQGYFPMKESSDRHLALVEGWTFCRRAFDLGEEQVNLAELWARPEFEPLFRRLVVQLERLVQPVMQCMLTYLGCDPHMYDEKLARTAFIMRFNHYPPVTQEDDETGAGRLPGHSDVSLFTLLPAPQVEGLQVLNQQTGKWIRVKAPPGSVILNTGDYMTRITNDRIPSTTHRVSKPRDPAHRAGPRTSFPLIVVLRDEDVMEVLPSAGAPKYEPITMHDFHTASVKKFLRNV